MRHLNPFAFVCLSAIPAVLATGCSVDRYTLQGRVVADPADGADSLSARAAGRLAGRPVPGATVRLVADPDDSLNRRELGVFQCDSEGRFQVRDINAPGVELVPYRLRVDAYAPRHATLHCDTNLPSPGRVLVLRMTPADERTGSRAVPAPTKAAPGNDNYLRNTLRESEPYLSGGK